MRKHPVFQLVMAAVTLMLVQSIVFADTVTSTIITEFNNMNGPFGYVFQTQTTDSPNYFSQSGEIRLANYGSVTPNLYGYKLGVTANDGTGEDFYFQTFCIEPYYSIFDGSSYNGTLSYDSRNDTSRTSCENTLRLGVAYLYKEFADGSLAGYSYTYSSERANDAVKLQDALWFLMGRTGYMVDRTTNWTTNPFLAHLLIENPNPLFWTAAYDPTSNYDGLMEDAKVFVMLTTNLPFARSAVDPYQDLLYVYRAQGSSDVVPEPATLLLWTLGSLGTAAVAYRKRQRTTQK